MPTKRDFYAAHALRQSQDIVALHRRNDIDPLGKIRIASAGYADDLLKGGARELYLQLAHQRRGISALNRQLAEIRRTLAEPLLPEAFAWADTTAVENLRLPAFLIEFYFKLATPLLTRDETGHYPIDNPLRKDTALQLPIFPASSWKGLLHMAFLEHQLYPSWYEWKKSQQNEANRLQYLSTRWRKLRLFGTEKEAQKDQPVPEMLQKDEADWETFLKKRFKKPAEPIEQTFVPPIAGSLYTFPSFFSALDVEVINPHDEIRRVGTQPIHIEAVPSGSTGIFRLLYVQRYDMLLPNEKLNPELAAKADLQAIFQSISRLFLESGIAGKRTSGYGQAEDAFPLIDGNRGRLVQNFLQPPSDSERHPLHEQPMQSFSEMAEFKINGGS